MTGKTSRKTFSRAALVMAAGLLLFTAGPMRTVTAAESKTAEPSKPLALTTAKKARIQKASGARKAKIAALKAAKRKPIASKDDAKAVGAESKMPESVANANAQMPAIDARGAAAMTGTPPLEAAAAEQLTELGKSLTAFPANDEPQQIAIQIASNDQPQAIPTVVAPEPARPMAQASAGASNDAWAQSSLIGKIFIALGGALTLASAARMLVA